MTWENHSLLVRLVRHMRSNDEPTIFVLSRRRAGDAWAPERVESKKPGGAAKLDTISENITLKESTIMKETLLKHFR